MKQLAQGIASLGRGEDKMLVHMTPGEVAGLQHLAMSHGGSLTINPHTGLPEAGYLSSLLSIGGGIVGGIFGGPLGAAAGSSLGSLVGGDDTETALKHGLMSGVGGALFGSAADAASQVGTGIPVTEGILSAAPDAVNDTTLSALDTAVSAPYTGFPTPAGVAVPPVTPQAQMNAQDLAENYASTPNKPVTPQAQMNAQDLAENYASTPNKPGMWDQATDWMGKNKALTAGLGLGALGLMNSKPGTVPTKPGPGGDMYGYAYHPAQYGPDGRAISQASYGTPTVTHYAAAGGPIYEKKPRKDEMYTDDSDDADYIAWLKGQKQRFASGGGIAALPNEYAAGGKLLQGPGDGMSDSIPAVIKGPHPQRAALAQGEFVIPADVVSHLGNGSTDAGSKRLYAMMDKVRQARTGTKKQGRQIDPAHFMPA